jgi:hypothetical protein
MPISQPTRSKLTIAAIGMREPLKLRMNAAAQSPRGIDGCNGDETKTYCAVKS